MITALNSYVSTSDFNTGINTAQICGGIPVFSIPGYRYWRPYLR